MPDLLNSSSTRIPSLPEREATFAISNDGIIDAKD
jgi:hypothetical protein